MKNPPILIAVLGFFAALVGFGFLFFGLRVVGFDWFGALGDLPALERVGLWGWLAIATGIVWLLAALGLWALQPWARIFAMIIAGIALLEAALAFFQFPGSGIGFAMAIMPILILWYLGTREVKEAFGQAEPVPSADEPPPSETGAAPVPAAAPVAVAAPLAAAAAVEETRSPAPAPVVAPVAAAAPVVAAAPEPAPAPEPLAPPAAAPAAASGVHGEGTQPPHHMRIDDVEGIGPGNSEKLAAVGIRTTDDLLAAGAKPYDRERLAERTGISSTRIRDWVDKVDLMRVPGVGPQYSDLLVAAGVGSPAELAQRNPANLAITVQEVVAARPAIVRRVPSEPEIAAWIEAAAGLESAVEH